MSKSDTEFLETLLRAYEKQAAQPQYHTFFGIIGRQRDEDLISRMLAYLLERDRALCAALFAFYAERKAPEWGPIGPSPATVTCEKDMEGGRADIFIEVGGYTLTIENKINSWEHGEQTEKYVRYVSSHYKDAENGFLYLKPDYNLSEPHSRKFAVMRYGELLELMERVGGADGFEEDFKRHIKKYLIDWNGEIMETDEMILQNYGAFKAMFESATEKYAEVKREVERALKSGELFGGAPISDYRGVAERGVFVSDNTKDTNYRIYKNKEWYDDACDYYFYLEAVMEDPREIHTQMVVHEYSDRKNRIKSGVRRFMDERGKELVGGKWYGRWFTSSPEGKFCSDAAILSDKWRTELFRYIRSTLESYLPQMDRLVGEFLQWQKGGSAAGL